MTETTPPSRLALPRVRSRMELDLQRLSLSWHAMRNGRGRGVALRREGPLFRVHDGTRQLVVPHVRRAADFKNGINARIEEVAEKYVGATGFRPREGDVVVDIGAGIGEFTLWCADAGAKVVAFEPDPLAFACLERNVQALSDVEALPYALWKERANLRLHGSLDTSESSLIEDGRTEARNADVEAWPLDRLQFMARLPVIDLMKVDGEGVEPEIVAGAARTLKRTRVVAVDIGAVDRRPNLRARVEMVLETLSFRPLAHGMDGSILALNTAMVGPFSTRVSGRPGS